MFFSLHKYGPCLKFNPLTPNVIPYLVLTVNIFGRVANFQKQKFAKSNKQLQINSTVEVKICKPIFKSSQLLSKIAYFYSQHLEILQQLATL
jgi:hypothetical protein